MTVALLDRKTLVISIMLIVMLTILSGVMALYLFSDPGLKQALVLTRAAKVINNNYPDKPDWDEMLEAGRRSIFDRLDRYSSFMEPVQFDWMDTEMSGAYTGIGVTVVNDELGLMILSARESGPAAKAGLMTGDIVMEADSTSLVGLSFNEAASLLRGEEGSKVLLRVYRPMTTDSLSVKVTREKIKFVHLSFAGLTPDSAIYLRLLDFDAGASDAVEAALDSLLTEKTKASIRGVILDLRGNPGGLFREARRTADLFLDKGEFIVGTDGRSRWEDKEYFAGNQDKTYGLPVIVLTDRGSASASEIVAGALQQASRAAVVGDTTFGKGLVQGFYRFPDGEGLRLTISRYYIGDKIYLNNFDSALNDVGSGLVPDYYYQDVDRELFPLRMESSLLINRYVGLYQDEIIASTDSIADEQLLNNFIIFANKSEFKFRGTIYDEVKEMKELAIIDKRTPDLIRAINSFEQISIQDDQNSFYVYRQYILKRLKQTAYERKYGNYIAYRDVIIRSSGLINFAESLLAGTE